MPDYRRWYVPGGTYFFTVATYRRYPFFKSHTARQLLGEAMRAAKRGMSSVRGTGLGAVSGGM